MCCKLCKKKDGIKFSKSHIIPKSLYGQIIKKKESALVISGEKNTRIKKSRIGEYDQSILCVNCEKEFDSFDNYAAKFFTQELHEKNYFKTIYNHKLAYIFPDYNYGKLKLFFLSMAWRASVSRRNFFSNINLGPYEESFREMIINNDPGDHEKFSVIIGKYTDPNADAFLMNPCVIRVDGVRFYKFYFLDYFALIKADKQATPSSFTALVMTPFPQLRVLLCKLSEVKNEVRAIRRISQAHRSFLSS